MSARRHRRSPAPARVFTIPPGLSFLDALAAGLIARAGQDPLALSAMTVLLPTRRACRSLEAAFLRRSEGRALLLPAIRPLGDIDEDALAEEAGLEAADAAALDLAPAIPRLRRRLLLAREVLDWSLKHKGDAPTRGTLTPDQAARLADELAHLIDQVETERLSFAALDGLVPADYAAHWQQTLRFLKLITRHWPKLLKSLDLIDPALHRDRGLSALARSYRQNPPAHPVIAAGSTGSIPATAELLGAIAHLPEGAVVLPGLDRTLDEESWQALEPTHPQYGLKFLLERLGVAHQTVPDWPTPLEPTTPASRAWVIAAALRPAAAPARRLERAALNAALRDVVRIDCANPREEAGVIAFILRETLESEGKRAALVTLDRMLARRVAAALKRFGVVVDDSAGLPLAKTPPGTFLRLIAEAAAERWPPVKFLAALKHPLAACGLSRLRLIETVRRIELAVLRGPRPAPGLAGLREALSKQARDPALGALVGGLERLAAPFDGLIAAHRASARELVRQHLALAEALAVEEKEAGR
ncbi:MAG TPA: double-strand break repair protein AddB, partial [Alphaproteobacteria bacterium]|nr:double-strand break repair protein AddB [Alphaproteobacteria bacterium]